MTQVKPVDVSCDNLKVSQKMETKKNTRMDINGVFAIQCSHIVVQSLVDLPGGEQYVPFIHCRDFISDSTLGMYE
jgi:hypothetical protein